MTWNKSLSLSPYVPSEACIILLNGLRFNLAFVLYLFYLFVLYLFVPEIQQTLQLGIPILPNFVSARK